MDRNDLTPMKIGVDKYGIVDFKYISFDGVSYAKHGDSQLIGKPVIDGFKFTISTKTHIYDGRIELKDSPYIEYTEGDIVTTANVDVDFPITVETISDAGLEWLDSRDLDCTVEERANAIAWLKTQTKFSVIDWFRRAVYDLKGENLMKRKMAIYLLDLPLKTVSFTEHSRDGQVKNFMADLVVSRDGGPEERFAIHETVLKNGIYYLFISE